MRSNIVSEAGLSTRLNQWWEGIPFVTSMVLVVCSIVYFVCLLVGYDSFAEVCFWPTAVVSRFQVYRFYTAILFHGSLLHLTFNMLALVPMGSELERIMGSIRISYIMVLLATSNAVLHLLLALIVAHNPLHHDHSLMDQCSIGFSGILFSLIVIETSLSGAQHRSVFGLFNVPAKWYVWILLVIFQLLMTNVSFLGHLCGILSGYAYTFGLFNAIIPGAAFYSSIESANWLSNIVRRPKFMVSTGNSISSHIPSHSSLNASPRGLLSGNTWRNLSSWMARNENAVPQVEQDSRFPGRARTLGGNRVAVSSAADGLETGLLENGSSNASPPTREDESVGRRILVGFANLIQGSSGDEETGIGIGDSETCRDGFR
ncbi:hypothetical protein M569_13261 [Genlisea aurea]|uniref:Peptidase S54 rhomboid domain-containing protein n=1 Tax=Genlisea aurea TaxID=192259 RepID=S8CAX9_9LAMI|nr:hypothetical protein M569_13261 [Genlisea aurea]